MKTNKIFIAVLIFSLIILIAAAVFVGINYFADGSTDPVVCARDYILAAYTYDVSSMIKYSAPYNKRILYGDDDYPGDSELKKKLEKLYESEKNYIKIEYELKLTESYKITDEILLSSLRSKLTGDDFAEEFQYIKFAVYADGKKTTDAKLYAVKSGGRWFYFSPAAAQ